MMGFLDSILLQAAASMGLILLTWVVVAACCLGWGRIGLAACTLRVNGAGGVWDTFWLGWVIFLLILQVVHLAAPMNGIPVAVATAVGGLGWLARVGPYRPRLGLPPMGKVGWALTAIGAGVWLANRSLGTVNVYDAGLYHLSAIRWAVEYPIVTGLANLHSRLAMFSPYFLYLAAVAGAGWGEFGGQVGAGLLLWVSISAGLYSLWRLVTHRGEIRATDVFCSLFLLPLVRLAFPYAYGPSPDLPVFLYGFVTAVGVVRLLEPRRPAEAGRFLVLATALMALSGITMKLSYGPLAAGVLAVLAWIAHRRRLFLGAQHQMARQTGAAAALALVVIGVWLVRNVIVSGYPLYPLTVFRGHLSWALPEDRIRSDAAWIASWARKPGEQPARVLRNWDWLGSWWHGIVAVENCRFDVLYPLVVFAAGAFTWSLWGRRLSATARISPLLLLPGGIAALAWFALAPEPRLAGAGLWWLGIGALSGGVLGVVRGRNVAARGLAVALLLAIAATHWSEEKLVNPGPFRGFQPAHAAALVVVQTDSGLEVFVPRAGDRCWYAALPCTPNPDPALTLLRRGDLSSGFVLDEEASVQP